MATEWKQPLEWQNAGTEPSDALKQAGFQGGYKPPAGIFNYQWHLLAEIIKQIQSEVDKKPDGQATMTAKQILSSLLTVDGTGSQLDADLLDGKHASDFVAIEDGKIPDASLPSNIITEIKLGTNALNAANGVVTIPGASDTQDGYVTKTQVSTWNAKTQVKSFSVTAPATGWGDAAPYSQSITVDGLTDGDAHLYLSPATAEQPAEDEETAFACITGGTTAANSLTLYCRDDKPAIDINVRLEVIS